MAARQLCLVECGRIGLQAFFFLLGEDAIKDVTILEKRFSVFGYVRSACSFLFGLRFD